MAGQPQSPLWRAGPASPYLHKTAHCQRLSGRLHRPMDGGRGFAEVEEADTAFTRSTREDMNAQRTLRRPVSCTGIGLHSGNKVTLSLKPAPADYGIRFQRSDLGGLEIPATVTHLGGIQYQTGLTREAVSVETVEHLLAALTALGIDNAIVELNHPGSADHGRQRGAVRLPDPERGGRQETVSAAAVPEGAAADFADPRRQAHRALSVGPLQGHLQHQLRPSAPAPSVADDADYRGDASSRRSRRRGPSGS